MKNPDVGRIAATICAVILFGLALAAWPLRTHLDGELLPGVELLSLGAGSWATATIIGLFGPAPAERAVLFVLAASVIGLIAGSSWVVVETVVG